MFMDIQDTSSATTTPAAPSKVPSAPAQPAVHPPLSIKYQLVETVVLYKKMGLSLLTAVLIPSLITFILSIAFKATSVAAVARANGIDEVFSFARLETYVMLLFIVAIAVVQLMSIIVPIYLILHHEKEETSVVVAFERSVHYFSRFVVFGIAVLALMILSLLVGYVVYFVLALVIGMMSLGTLEAARPYLSWIPLLMSTLIPLFFMFVGFSIVDRDHSAKQAIRDSVVLVKGHFWKLLLHLVILYTTSIILVFALQYLPRIGNFIALTVVAPFIIVYISTLYRSLTEMKLKMT